MKKFSNIFSYWPNNPGNSQKSCSKPRVYGNANNVSLTVSSHANLICNPNVLDQSWKHQNYTNSPPITIISTANLNEIRKIRPPTLSWALTTVADRDNISARSPLFPPVYAPTKTTKFLTLYLSGNSTDYCVTSFVMSNYSRALSKYGIYFWHALPPSPDTLI